MSFWTIILLILGFVLLIKGADFFVDGASAVAKQFNVPTMIIGLTIIALGTSLPELAVSVKSSFDGNNSLAISNVVGSNMFNLMVVLGLSALLNPIKIKTETIKKDYPFSIACTIILGVIGLIGLRLGRFDGFILVVLLIGFILYQIYRGQNSEETTEIQVKDIGMKLAIVYIVGGAVAIKFGGDFVVNSAVTLAQTFGLSETIIGLTIVACGTSLPELVTSLVAAKKGEVDMAVGNVIGSNIFNILMILGVSSLISPITLLKENIIDIIVFLAFSLLTYVFCKTKDELGKVEGGILFGSYIIYMIIICLR